MVAKVFGLPSAPDYYEHLFGVAPYALRVLGSSFVANTDYAVGDDLMGGAALVKTGTPVDHGTYATTSDTAYWENAFTGTALVNAAGSQTGCTILAVARAAAAANKTLVSCYQSGNTSPAIVLECPSTFLARANILGTANKTATLPNDAARGSRFAMYGLTLTPTETVIYERHAGMSAAASSTTSFASQTIGGGGTFRMGHRFDLTGDGVDLAAVAMFSRKLTAAEIDAAYAAFDQWLGVF